MTDQPTLVPFYCPLKRCADRPRPQVETFATAEAFCPCGRKMERWTE